MDLACKAARGNSIIVPTMKSNFILFLLSISLAILLTNCLKIFNSDSVETRGIIISINEDFILSFFSSTDDSNIALHCIS